MVVATQRLPNWNLLVELEEAPDGIYADQATLPELKSRVLTLPTDKTPPPLASNLSATVNSRITNDGSAVSTLTVAWDLTRFASTITVQGANNFRVSGSVIKGNSIEFDISAPGDYVVTHNFVSAVGVAGANSTANVSVDWSGLVPPSPRLVQAQIINYDILFTFHQVVSALDVSAIDFRYRFKGISDSSAFTRTLTEAQFLNLARFSASPFSPSAAGEYMSSSVQIAQTGRYQVWARLVLDRVWPVQL